MVDLVAVSSIWRDPRQLVDVQVCEEGSSYHQVVHGTELHKSLPIVGPGPHTMIPHASLIVAIVIPDLGIEVPHDDEKAVSWGLFHLCLQLVVEVVFVLVAAVIGWCVALDDSDVNVFSLQSCTYQSAVDWLPL